jgi:hypothetical protein
MCWKDDILLTNVTIKVRFMFDTNTGLVFLGIRIGQYYISCVQSFTPSRTDQLLYERLRQGFC